MGKNSKSDVPLVRNSHAAMRENAPVSEQSTARGGVSVNSGEIKMAATDKPDAIALLKADPRKVEAGA